MLTKLKALSQSDDFMRYFRNSSWMFSEYLLKIISAIFVMIYVARYLGPEQFGILSYALAIVSIFMAISRLGMESILVRDLAKKPEQSKQYMGTAFSLMVIAAVGGFVVLSAVIYFFEADVDTRLYIWIIASGLLFQTFLVIDYSFQAQVKSKFSSIAKTLALGISSIIKIYLVWIGADLYLFAIAHAFDHLIIAVSLYVMFLAKKQESFLFFFDPKLVADLLSSAWPMVLSALAIMLYMRIDQIMIKNMLGSHALGLYAAATKIYEGWMVIPYVISLSLLPAIVKLKEKSTESYEESLIKIFAFVFWLGIFVALIITFFGSSIIYLTFGEEYKNSSMVLVIIMWTAAFTSLGSLTARYLTVEGMEKKMAFRTFFALIMNVLLNFILIPLYGIEGAAIATLITIVVANYFINYTDRDLKQLVRICNDAIFMKFKLSKVASNES